MGSKCFVDINRKKLFSHPYKYSIQFWVKSKNLKTQNGAAFDVIYLTMVAMETSYTPRGYA